VDYIPKLCSFDPDSGNYNNIKKGTFIERGELSKDEGQQMMDTIRYMNGLPASVQFNVLLKAQFVHDDSALLERYFLAHYINSYLQKNFNFDGFEMRPYGSAVTGFSNKYSDLDLCLIDHNAGNFSKYESYEENFRRWRFEARKLMAELYDALNDHGRCKIPGISDQQLIDTAKHPIIKSQFSPLDLEFDFGYNDKSLLAMAQLHNYFSSLDPRIIPFIGIIRLWSKLVGFSAHGLSGQMTPYIITQMALNYLQKIRFIPSIQALKKTAKDKLHLGEEIGFFPDLKWRCELRDSSLERAAAETVGTNLKDFRENNPVIPELYKKDSLHILLYGFLDFIEHFDQRKYKLCSLTGEIQLKEKMSASLVVTHPFAPSKNIAGGVKYEEYLRFKIGCSSNKYKFLYDLYNEKSFPDLKNRPDLCRTSDVSHWTGLSAFLNPYIRFDPTTQNAYVMRDIDPHHESFLISEGITKKNVGVMLQASR